MLVSSLLTKNLIKWMAFEGGTRVYVLLIIILLIYRRYCRYWIRCPIRHIYGWFYYFEMILNKMNSLAEGFICFFFVIIHIYRKTPAAWMFEYENASIDWTGFVQIAKCEFTYVTIFHSTLNVSHAHTRTFVRRTFSSASYQNTILIGRLMISVTLLSISSILNGFCMLLPTLVLSWPFFIRLTFTSHFIHFEPWDKKLLVALFFLYLNVGAPISLTQTHTHTFYILFFVLFVSIALGSFVMIVN